MITNTYSLSQQIIAIIVLAFERQFPVSQGD